MAQNVIEVDVSVSTAARKPSRPPKGQAEQLDDDPGTDGASKLPGIARHEASCRPVGGQNSEAVTFP